MTKNAKAQAHLDSVTNLLQKGNNEDELEPTDLLLATLAATLATVEMLDQISTQLERLVERSHRTMLTSHATYLAVTGRPISDTLATNIEAGSRRI